MLKGIFCKIFKPSSYWLPDKKLTNTKIKSGKIKKWNKTFLFFCQNNKRKSSSFTQYKKAFCSQVIQILKAVPKVKRKHLR